jgi:hypothetical protein
MHEQFLADLRKGQIDLRWSFSKIRVDPREVMPYWIEILRSAQYEIFPPTGYTDKVSTIFGSLNRYGEEAKDAAEPLLRIMNNRMQPLRACEINASVNPSDQVIPRVFWAQTWRLTIKFTSSEKQSRLWLDGFRGVGRAPEGHLWIDICDRAGDFFQAMQLSRELNHHFLIRVVQDRCVKVCKSDPQSQEETQTIEHVHEVIRQITACTNKTILVTGKGGRRSREVKTQVGYAKVTLQPPKPHGFRRGMRSLPLTLIRVWEDGVDLTHAKTQATKQKESETQEQLQLAQNENRKAAEQVKAASGVLEKAKSKAAKEAARQDLQEANRQASEALSLLQKRQEAAEQAKQTHKQASQTEQGMLDWWLGTSLPINTPEEALQAVSDYEWRWPVAEEYHKVEKSGLQMEKQRFRGDALLAMMAVLSILAIRILQMRYAREGDPQGPATSIASREEIEMVEMVSKQVGKLTTVAKWVDAVAKLGGYLGRKGDGPPGWMTLWRGYQRLRDILLGAELALSNQANKGEVNQEA